MMADMLFLITPAFMMGLLGSTHCAGMCGGIACAMCYKRSFPFLFTYNLGRLFTYSVLGIVTGSAGIYFSQMMGAAYPLRYLAAIFMILTGLYIGGWLSAFGKMESAGKWLWQPVSLVIKQLFPITSLPKAFVVGSLWGLLPCGLVYSALIYALSMNHWLMSGAVMFSFGLGTLPALLLIGSVSTTYQRYLQHAVIRQTFGILLIALGILSMLFTARHHLSGIADCLG